MAEATLSLNGSGVYSPNTAGQPVQSGTIITSTAFNALIDDMTDALSLALYKDGQQVATANQPMGGFQHTNVGNASARTQYASAGQAQDGALTYLTGVSGTNTILASVSPTPGAYVAGQRFTFIVGTTNTGAATLNVSSLGAQNIRKKMSGGKVAITAVDLVAGQSAEVFYDGTDFILETARTYSHGADVASAGTINLDTATGDLIDVTGTTSITAITLAEGEERTVRFTGALTLTNGASLVLPGAADITTAAGDFAVFRGYASGVVRCVIYSLASGLPLSGVATGIMHDYLGTTAPSGFILADGRTMGSAASGATNRANADTAALYTLLWNSMADAEAPVSSGRGASAAADFAANKTITVPDLRSRTTVGRDDMGGTAANRITNAVSGFVGTTLGTSGGLQSHTLTAAEAPVLTVGLTTSILSATGTTSLQGNNAAVTNNFNTSGGGGAHRNVQPSYVVNKIIKL